MEKANTVSQKYHCKHKEKEEYVLMKRISAKKYYNNHKEEISKRRKEKREREKEKNKISNVTEPQSQSNSQPIQ